MSPEAPIRHPHVQRPNVRRRPRFGDSPATPGAFHFRLPMVLAPLVVVALLIGLAACRSGGGEKGGPGDATALRGTIKVSGAWALYPMMVRWGEEFRKLHPGVRVDISAGGAGKGAADALAGLVDLGMVSRAVRPEEIRQGAVFVPVVKDAVFPTFNAANPAAATLAERGVRRETLASLWLQGKRMDWGALAGQKTPGQVQIYTRSDSCGAAETWAAWLGGEQEDLQGVAVYGDPGLAQAVRSDPLGIGFNNLNFAFDPKTGRPVAGLAILPLDLNGNGRVDPDEVIGTKAEAIRAIAAGVYPSPPARDLYLITRGRFQGLSAVFVRWILTDGMRFVDEVGYIAPTDDQRREALERLGH
jgi:phosphate transport system substrate-binding protein